MFSEQLTVGINSLSSWQQKDGSFLSLSSTDPNEFTNPRIFHSVFANALILSCMNELTETPVLKQMKKRAVAFLLTQKSKDWSFNYWVRQSKESESMPYPDDLDDTFCALAALHEYNASLLDGSVFAKVIQILTSSEVKEGGPYRTWLVSNDAPTIWKDVDIAVNSNIAYFLSLQDIELPNVTGFIENAISDNKVFSQYYNGDILILYFISRWYKGSLTQKLITHLIKLKNKERITDIPLYNALLTLSLLKLNVSYEIVSDTIAKLVKQQQADAWEPFGIYIDPVIDGKKHYAGSKALTTAFCLLALNAYMSASKHKTFVLSSDADSHNKFKIDAAVMHVVRKRFSQVDKTLQQESKKIIDYMLLADVGKQITLFPYLIASSLSLKKRKVPESLLISLGSASLYGWIAYTIYDNFIDDEGDPKTIPVANISLRELTLIFTSVLHKSTEFLDLFKKTMDAIDKANIWELNNSRFIVQKDTVQLQTMLIPNYGNYKYLANRSMGHSLAATAVLFYLGYKKESVEVKLLLKFFYHYIIARQLNDDAHDFVNDLKKGHINAVGARVLTLLRQKYKDRYPSRFSQILTIAPEIFWTEIVGDISNDILYHVAKGRKAIEDNPILGTKDAFIKILSSVESSAKRALHEQTNVTEFLQTYK